MPAHQARGDNNSLLRAVVLAVNELHDQIALGLGQGASGGAGATGLSPTGYFHRDLTSLPATGYFWDAQQMVPMTVAPVGPTGPSGLLSAYNVVQDLQGKLLAHFSDDNAHLVRDLQGASGIQFTIPVPSGPADYTGICEALSGIQRVFNAHLAAVSPTGVQGPVAQQVHPINDTLNTNSTATTVSTGAAFTLAGSLASGVSAHLAAGPAFGRVQITKS